MALAAIPTLSAAGNALAATTSGPITESVDVGPYVSMTIDTTSLTCTGAVVREARHLYPPTQMFARTTAATASIDGTGISGGGVIIGSPFITHRLSDPWRNPDRFDPRTRPSSRSLPSSHDSGCGWKLRRAFCHGRPPRSVSPAVWP